MTDSELINSIRLLHTEGIGCITFYKLINKFGSATKSLEYLSNSKKINIFSKSLAEQEVEKASTLNVKILSYNSTEYPKVLKQIPDAPPILYVKGNISALQNKSVALVGSRNASINSKSLTQLFAKELADYGYTIVSGMAIGIDTYAHIGALSSDKLTNQKTIAVLAGGVDVIYPISNNNLYDKIISEGAVISEMMLGTMPQANLFPKRNRIISGLSYGTVVMEASIKSGSLITARCALEQNREVFAVPNFPRDPRAGGTNMLIKNGANLVETSQDIISILDNFTEDSFNKEETFFELKEDNIPYLPKDEDDFDSLNLQEKILSLLDTTAINVDILLRELTDYKQEQIFDALLNLELDDKISYSSTGKIMLKL